MATLGELKGHAVRLYARGDALAALRCYDAVVAVAPLDYDARMKVADCLVALGERAAATDVYRAVAWFCVKAGHPLDAVVCARLVEATSGTPAEEIVSALVAMYGSGSDALGKLGARLAPPSDDTQVPSPPDLRTPPPPSFLAEAAQRAHHCLDGFDEYPEALHAIPLLSELSDQAFRRVLSALLVKRLPDGAMVIREGEPGTSFFFLAGGMVRVYSTDSLGQHTELARLHEGSLFGEMALISSQPRTASVAVVGEADLLEITRDALAGIAGELAQVAAALDRFTRERLLKNLVGTSPIFRPFSRVQQLDLLRRFTSHDAAPGTVIIREGDEGRGLFVVLTGEVEVVKCDEAGVEVPIATLKAGELFGEIALLRGTPATATVTAARQSTVLFLGRDYFVRLLEAVPEIRQYFEQLSEDRLMEAQLMLSDDQIVEEDEIRSCLGNGRPDPAGSIMKDVMENTDSDATNSNGSGSGKSGRRGWVWLLLLLAVALVWWFWKPPADNARAADNDDIAAAASADPDDILVDLRDDLSDSQVAALAGKYGLTLTLVSAQSHDEQFYRAHVDPAQRDTLLAALAKDGAVETAEPDAEYQLIGEATAPAPLDSGYPNDPQYKFQWHLRQIGMPEAWKLAQGDGVIVAVIDTGVAYEDFGRFHRVPDLAGVTFVKGFDFVGNKPHGNDDHGHGTHVAGTIAQATNNGIGVAGVAPHASIMPLKVLGAGGSGSTAGIADAIRYAADNGAKVINMSLGGRFRSKVLEKAVKYAHDKGVVVVCAAGNDGSNRVSYPAAYAGAIAVAATQFDQTTTFYSNRGKEIDVAAPGGNTQVDQNNDGMPDGVLQNTIEIGNPEKDGYFPFMGTSMASPHVAGVAALIVGAGVTEPDAVEKILKSSARAPTDGPNKGKADTVKYGAGIIDAPAALKAARSNAGGWQLGLGLLLAGAVAASARKRGLAVRLGPSYVGGVLLGASGLFFLPWLGSIGERLSSLPVVETMTYGFPSWDLALLGPAGHGNALFFSALAPFGLLALLYSVPRLRGLLAGFALGVAGHLLFHAVAGFVDVRWVPNLLMLDQVWLALNAAACAGLAYLSLRRD